MFWDFLAGQGFWGAFFAAVLGAAYTVIKPYLKQWLEDHKLEQLYSVFETGVINTYATYTKEIKKAKEDGSLTAEEAEKARQICLEFAINFFKAQGRDIVAEYTKDVLNAFIENALVSAKENNIVK